MQQNELLIHNFYIAFLDKDFKTMQATYADNATFSDPVFQNLNATQTRGMWEMFCKRGKDMQLTFEILSIAENQIVAEWIPRYTFSATGNYVVNHITSTFIIADNKITQHTDNFNFYKWSCQALGFRGVLLGWTAFMQNKIRKTAMANLTKFIATNNN